MKLLHTRTVLVVFTSLAALMAFPVQAEHVTTYLEPLHAAVTNRLAETNLTAGQTRALRAASKALSGHPDKPQAELGLLANAARTLNARFTNDFLFEENEALGSYSYDLNNLLDDIASVIGTNPVPRSVTNKLAQGTKALARGDNTSNSVPVRARALALSLTKLSAAAREVIRLLGPAPAAVEDRLAIRLDENAPVNDRTFYNFVVDGWIWDSHGPNDEEELGLWTYTRTGPSNAIITAMPNYPSNDVPRDFKLVFTNLDSGTFTGTNLHREFIQGGFQTLR